MKCRDPEVSTADKYQPNPVPRPDISVSRINARSIAVQPPDSRLLDANGKPQTTSATPPINFGYENWKFDAITERRLLIDYFDRNHAFRSGKYSDKAFGVSLIESANLGTVAANQGLEGLNGPREEVCNATLLDFTRWLKSPAIFRAVSAHADCMSTTLLPTDDAHTALAENEAGGHPWRWVEENGKYIPSFKGHYTADFFLYRTMWENGKLSGIPPSLMLHVGCDVNAINHTDKPYNIPPYGTLQNAECLLFYGNQLSVLCRTTWWNEGPYGFGNSFGKSATAVMGDGWKGISERISQNAELAQHTTQRKQNWIWSIVGDWTLQKYYLGLASEPTMFQNRQNSNYEMVVTEGNQLQHYWFGYGGNWQWNKGEAFGTNVQSAPVMFQNCTNNHYELVVREGDHLQHYWYGHLSNGKWNKGEAFGANVQSAAMMFQNRVNNHYELVVREGDHLQHYWFDYLGNGKWNKGDQFGANVQSAPTMFQNAAPNPPDRNHYELVVREGDHLQHYWFGYLGNGKWNKGDQFGANVQSAPTMFQNAAPNLPDANNYELIVREGDQLRHYWFDYGGDWKWHKALIISPCSPSAQQHLER